MTNNEPDISTKNVQNGKETTADTAPETSWVPKNPPPAAAQAEPVRRVGSVTLGICLITAGIFFFAYHFLPNFDALLVLKIVPAAGLVLLGCEVLYYATRPQRGRYDFVSVFVCLVLMACCFGLTLLPLVWEQVNPEVQQQEQRLRDAYQQSVYEKFQQEASDIRLKDMGCWVELYSYHNDAEKLTPDNTETLGLNVWLQGPYDSAEAFAKDCRRLTDEVQKMDVQPTQVGFYYRGFSDADSELLSDMLVQKANYTLYLDGEIQLDWTAAEMEKATDVEFLLDEENTEDAVESSHSDTN